MRLLWLCCTVHVIDRSVYDSSDKTAKNTRMSANSNANNAVYIYVFFNTLKFSPVINHTHAFRLTGSRAVEQKTL